MDKVREKVEGSPVAVAVSLGCAALASPTIWKGLKLTVKFIKTLSVSAAKQNRIDGYNSLQEGDDAGERNEQYAELVDSYYDLATSFYEWGWGSCFHFADKRTGESFHESLRRHEYYLASRLNVKPGDSVLDCGCGIGGPARNIARFTRAKISAITINQGQVDRAKQLSKDQGLADLVLPIQGDFMALPFSDASFDAVYAIEATCHAPDRSRCYSEILRVLKPGAVFACYEWCLTDAYDPNNPLHTKLKKDIEVGDGLPDLVHTSVCSKALKDAGFEIIEARDCALDGKLGLNGEPWYTPLTASWNPLVWPRFQFNPIMFRILPIILRMAEFARLVPQGTCKTQIMLQAGGIGCANGGVTGAFTPMFLMVARKPL